MIYGSRRYYAEYNMTNVNSSNSSNYFDNIDSAVNFASHTFMDGSSNITTNDIYNNNLCKYKDNDFYEIYGSVANDGHFLTRALL